MFRKLTVLLLALLLPASALAEVYEGTTAALSAVTVTAERAGVVGAAVEAGSRVEAGARIGMIPITNKHPEYAGALLEAMSSYGYNHLIPEYYEVALKRRTSRDSESAEMLDLIFETRRYDLGDTWWCNELRDGLFKNMFAEDNRNLASEIARQGKIINKTLSKVVNKLAG